MLDKGFENLIITTDCNNLIIAYENRVYRCEVRAMLEIIETVTAVAPSDTLILIPQNRKIPLIEVKIPMVEYHRFDAGAITAEQFASSVKASFNLDETWNKIKNIRKTNPSTYKIDIAVHPQFSILFVDRGKDLTQINLSPLANMTLWKGLSVSAQSIVPIQNNYSEEGDYIRPGLTTINQTVRLPYNTFVSGTGGYFTANRYGFDAEIKKYCFEGRFNLYGNFGYTDYAECLKGVWYYKEEFIRTFRIGAEYIYTPLNLSLSVHHGFFLLQDTGYRIDLVRRFGEVEVGFYTGATELGRRGGFHFSVPIFPPKYAKPGIVRIRPKEYFRWEYYYNAQYHGACQRYYTGENLDYFIERLNPLLIGNDIIKILNKLN